MRSICARRAVQVSPPRLAMFPDLDAFVQVRIGWLYDLVGGRADDASRVTVSL